ncbi:MAG: Tim44/TimA family putative adaptor protein [Thalassobaculaceae bacterium]|nr:Tim44/TimA family putative adaptor protein [Thalassobaculaceae bacterium]
MYAMIAGFLILKLRGVLGRRTGEEKQRPDPFSAPEAANESEQDNVISLPDRATVDAADIDDLDPLSATLMRIKLADPDFDDKEFAGGARGAFEMIVQAFAAGDVDTLKSLISGPLYGGFVQAIEEREQANESQETTIVTFRSADITEAELDGHEARVTVEFVTEQVKVTRDADGKVVDGDPDKIEVLTDIWTFERDVRSSDPNWELVAARVPEE